MTGRRVSKCQDSLWNLEHGWQRKVFKSEMLQNNYNGLHSYVSGIPKLKCQKCGPSKLFNNAVRASKFIYSCKLTDSRSWTNPKWNKSINPHPYHIASLQQKSKRKEKQIDKIPELSTGEPRLDDSRCLLETRRARSWANTAKVLTENSQPEILHSPENLLHEWA